MIGDKKMSNSGQLLTQEEVEALVEAVQSGDLDTEVVGSANLQKQYPAYDLISNDTTSKGQLAALEMIDDRFARQLRGELLTLLRQAVRVSLTPFEVTTFGKYLQSVPSPCNVNIVRFPPLRGYGLVTIDPSIVYGAVDSFFGGQGGGDVELSPQRGFTPTEERIIQILLDVVFENLRDAWAPVYGLEAEFVSREINPSFAQVGEERETVIVSRFDLEVGPSMKGQLTIMYPFSALKPIRLLLRGRMQTGERDEKLAARWAEQLQEAVSDAELEVIGQLGTLRLSAARLAGLKVGDTLAFKPAELVKMLIQSAHVFDAEYGASDGMSAVRIEKVIEPNTDQRPLSGNSGQHAEKLQHQGGTSKVGQSASTNARKDMLSGVNAA